MINNYKPVNRIRNKHMLTLMDYEQDEIFEILHLAKELKRKQKAGISHRLLEGKTLAMIFAKSSTRTRISFEQGIRQLGGYAMFLSSNDIQLGRGETIYDTVKVLNGYDIDGIMIRTFLQSDVEELAKYGNMPIINGLTDLVHPCQVLADLLTIWEVKGGFQGLKLAYFGDGNNMANSLMLGCAKCGIECAVATPKGYEPDPNITAHAQKYGKVIVTNDAMEAADRADILYTDVFFSMGQAKESEKFNRLMPFQVNRKLAEAAKPDYMFLHCLPAHRGEEVTAEIIDQPEHSVIYQEAENRLHAQKAVMALLMAR